MDSRQVKFKIYRFKQGQGAASWQIFSAGVNEDSTVLDSLQDIRRNQDPSLTFRHSCLHASCGTCGMKINGREQLACTANVLDQGSGAVKIEPLSNFPLISDLVVDMGDFYRVYSEPGMPYMRSSEFIKYAVPPKSDGPYQRFENCLECGLCVSACPITGSDPQYLGPAALAAAWRIVEEPRLADPKFALVWADGEHGCWRCHVAYECSEVCPSDVDPGGAIMGLRKAVAKRLIPNFFGTKE